MDIVFHVNNVTPVSIQTTAVVNGVSMPVTITGIEVGLVTDHNTSLQLRYSDPKEVAAIKAKFVPGKTITWTV